MYTVQQLISHLSTLPPDAPLVTGDEDSGEYLTFDTRVFRASSEEETFVTSDARGHECVVIVTMK